MQTPIVTETGLIGGGVETSGIVWKKENAVEADIQHVEAQHLGETSVVKALHRAEQLGVASQTVTRIVSGYKAVAGIIERAPNGLMPSS